MNLLKYNEKGRGIKLLISHLKRFLIYCFFLTLMLLFWKCPFDYFFGMSCVGCGLTRAYFYAFCLDFKSAFYYHPLFFLVVPTILYIFHRDLFSWRYKKQIEFIVGIILILAFVGVYIFRLLTPEIWGSFIRIDFSEGIIYKLFK